ncbi:MAG: DUF2520 domain-containing protein [Bacteroidia bacterium]|nr:DUF2520 domain-containing protein [Bacteroidia bacterium]
MKPVITVGFIGAGNLAWNMAHNLPEHYSIEQVIAKTPAKAAAFAKEFSVPLKDLSLSALHPDLDLVILATPDHSLAELARELGPFAGPRTAFIHASGTTPLSALDPLGKRTGVLWPMQTLRQDRLTTFEGVPLFIEAHEEIRSQVRDLAFSLSDKVIYLSSEDRLKMHCGAVMAGNFSTLMLELALRATQGLPGVSPAIFEPLIRRSLNNALETTPREAMTGPARRNDQVTMEQHLELLGKIDPELATLYQALSAQIQKMYAE